MVSVARAATRSSCGVGIGGDLPDRAVVEVGRFGGRRFADLGRIAAAELVRLGEEVGLVRRDPIVVLRERHLDRRRRALVDVPREADAEDQRGMQ